MKKSKYTEEQILFALKQADAGQAVAGLRKGNHAVIIIPLVYEAESLLPAIRMFHESHVHSLCDIDRDPRPRCDRISLASDLPGVCKPKANTRSGPRNPSGSARLLRLLPAGATIAGWGSQPLEDRAFARRTESLNSCRSPARSARPAGSH